MTDGKTFILENQHPPQDEKTLPATEHEAITGVKQPVIVWKKDDCCQYVGKTSMLSVITVYQHGSWKIWESENVTNCIHNGTSPGENLAKLDAIDYCRENKLHMFEQEPVSEPTLEQPSLHYLSLMIDEEARGLNGDTLRYDSPHNGDFYNEQLSGGIRARLTEIARRVKQMREILFLDPCPPDAEKMAGEMSVAEHLEEGGQ
jgi:hypothetical protein